MRLGDGIVEVDEETDDFKAEWRNEPDTSEIGEFRHERTRTIPSRQLLCVLMEFPKSHTY
jgi:hypothetical protein